MLPSVRALPLDASDTAPTRKLIEGCHQLSPNRGGMAKPMRVLICGVPNVGKSTLINTMSNKRQAKTGDEAGITKLEQRITLADDFYLWDTPGMLWPRITAPESGYNLAASGAVGRNAYDEELVALSCCGACSASTRRCWRRATNSACPRVPWPKCTTKSCSRPLARNAAQC